ncbi:MAG: hypothetical protein R6U56_03890, partial [Opitutales bacterium]
AIGLAALVMLTIYNKVINAANKDPHHNFNLYGDRWVKSLLIPITITLIAVTTWRMGLDSQAEDSNWPSVILSNLGLALNATFFSVMLIISFLPKAQRWPGSPGSSTG